MMGDGYSRGVSERERQDAFMAVVLFGKGPVSSHIP